VWDEDKLPLTVPSGVVIGEVRSSLAKELGLAGGSIAIVSGAHDQCANGIGCGVTQEGQAMLGMGTYFNAMPVFRQRQPADKMIKYGINTEHHAAPGLYVSFLYNHGGSMVKWYRDTFAICEHNTALKENRSIYSDLIAEIPSHPSRVMVLPHFEQTGPPRFIADSSGVIAGLKLSTKRGEILKGIMESALFYIRECLQPLVELGVQIDSFRVVGGGRDRIVGCKWQRYLGKPIIRPKTTEAGALEQPLWLEVEWVYLNPCRQAAKR
jgi:xylulokinase